MISIGDTSSGRPPPHLLRTRYVGRYEMRSGAQTDYARGRAKC
jgi:hypothetical protein